MRPHERLDVWKASLDLVAEIYRITKSFPKEEVYGLTSQIRRSAISIPSNIAEGCARKGKKERDQFLYIARGSLSELETQLHISLRLEFLDKTIHERLLQECRRISAMLDGLIQKAGPSPGS